MYRITNGFNNNLATIFVSAFTLFVLFALWSPVSSAAQTIDVHLDAEPLSFSVDPFIDEGTTLVQFRPLFEAMGLEIDWNAETKTITGEKDGLVLKMQIDNSEASVNGEAVEMLQAPRVVDGNTVVPIRFISESTGAIVSWNPYVPEIVIFTQSYWLAHGLTREELEEDIREALERIKEQNEAKQNEHEQPSDPVSIDEPIPDLNQLQGTYIGYRFDQYGYECGGLCTDIYTFLPNGNVVLGLPKNGGPETINCTQDECQAFQIANGQLTIGEEAFSIKVEEGVLYINDIEMNRVDSVGDHYVLSNTYEHIGYYGTALIGSYTVTWTYTFVFNADGTFEFDTFRLGTFESGVAITHGLSDDEGSGTYTIRGNTIELSFDNGDVDRLLFFIVDDEDPDYRGIQIGNEIYYLQ